MEFQIAGTESLDEGAVKSRILTSETSWFTKLFPWLPFTNFEYFDSNAWQADLRRIERYYEAQGYYQAEVVEEQVTPTAGDEVEIFVRVTEGEPTRIASLALSGLEGLPPEHRAPVVADIPLQEGEIFREEEWELTKLLLRERLRELGYAEASIEGEALVDVESQRAELSLVADPGKRYTFGNIFVATDANAQVPVQRIIEQTQGAIEKGDWYSESALAEAQARVFQMGVFAAVKVNRGAPDRASGMIPIVVDVREAPFHTVRLGGGVGFDQIRNEARVLSEYTNRNFLGGLRRFTARARVGYAFIPSLYAVLANVESDAPRSGPFFQASIELEQPRFLFRDVRGRVALTAERGFEQAYEYIGGGIRPGLIWQPHPDFSVVGSYNFEAYSLTGRALFGGSSPELAIGCAELAGERCLIALSYLEQLFEWDRRDDRIAPTRGYYLSLSLQEGGGLLGGTFDYFRVTPEARYYWRLLDGDLVVATRLRVGTLVPTGDQRSPILVRFYSGGSNMRGFNSRRLSPLQVVERAQIRDRRGRERRPDPPAELVPIGGDGLVEGSLEARFHLVGKLAGATFYDTGFVTTESLPVDRPASTLDSLQHAVGVGIRYLTVVGPVRVDFAYRLNVGPPLPVVDPFGGTLEYPTQTGCFGLFGPSGTTYAGGPEGQCSLHISIGEAF